MEGLAFLLLIVIAIIFVLPLVAIAKAAGARRGVEDLQIRLRDIEAQLQTLRRSRADTRAEKPPATEPEAAAQPETFAPPVPPAIPEERPERGPPPLPTAAPPPII